MDAYPYLSISQGRARIGAGDWILIGFSRLDAARREKWPREKGRASGTCCVTNMAGPERIESGWWDDGDARPDYFVAVDHQGRWPWIFRDLRPPGGG